jgi:mannose-1-phosphate guanylyltransferase/phosphomannomutase
MARKQIPVEWARKGAVMREMVERSKGRDVVLVDGVRIDHGESWVLVLPDADEAAVHVIAEANDLRAAQDLVEHYARRIADL